MSEDTTKSIAFSARRFFSGTMLSRITGMLRDMAMAFAFGTNSAIAAFMVAFRFAHLLRRFFGEGPLQSAFIPLFEELRRDDDTGAARFFRDLSATLTVVLTAIVAVGVAVLGVLWVYGGLSPGNAEIVWLTCLMLPSLLFICLFGVNAALLQCEKVFLTPSVAPVAFNVIWIGAVVWLRNLSAAEAMPYLAGGVVIACIAQWGITAPQVFLFWRRYGQESLLPKVKFFSREVRRLSKPVMLGIVGVAATQINSAFDAIFARCAGGEGPALLWYALRLQQLPLALFGIALSGALLPPLSRAIARGQTQDFLTFLQFGVCRGVALMVPCTAALITLGLPSINLLFGRGGFTEASTIGTTQCLWGYALGLLPMALTLILAPAYYARGDYRTPATASFVSMGVNIALNTLMVYGLNMGAASIAIATSISAWINLALLTHHFDPPSRAIITTAMTRMVGRVGAISAIASLAALYLTTSWLDASIFIIKSEGALARNVGDQLVHFLVPASVFAATLALFKNQWLTATTAERPVIPEL